MGVFKSCLLRGTPWKHVWIHPPSQANIDLSYIWVLYMNNCSHLPKIEKPDILIVCMHGGQSRQRLKHSCGHVMDGCVDTIILSSSYQTLLWEFHMILFSYSPKIEKKTFWFYAWRSTSMVLIKLSHGHVMYTCMNLLILSSPNGEKVVNSNTPRTP